MKRINLNPKYVQRIISSYIICTLLGAGLVIWFHHEQSGLLAMKENQRLKNEAEQIVVSSLAYELIMATDKKEITEEAIKDKLMKYISGKVLTIVAIEESENKKRNILAVEVVGDLREYFTVAEEISADNPQLKIEPKQLNKQNNQLHIQFTISS